MNPRQVAERLLESHVSGTSVLEFAPGIRVELQLGYSGLMAKGAYKQYKHEWNRSRRKVGCFDFKILDTTGDGPVPLVHSKVLRDAFGTVGLNLVEAVFRGADPEVLAPDPRAVHSLQEVQMSMLEQEVNWGDEEFQSKTYFLPSKGLRARDFIMAYLRRGYSEPGFLERIQPKRAASGTWGVLRPPIEKEWAAYREPKGSGERPWLEGPLLQRFRDAAVAMPDNPLYGPSYRDGQDP